MADYDPLRLPGNHLIHSFTDLALVGPEGGAKIDWHLTVRMVGPCHPHQKAIRLLNPVELEALDDVRDNKRL